MEYGIKAYKIIDGRLFLDGDKEAGAVYLVEDSGVVQMHGYNKAGSSIKAFKEIKKFLEDKKNIYSCCKSDSKVCRFLVLLGFKKWGEVNDSSIFSYRV